MTGNKINRKNTNGFLLGVMVTILILSVLQPANTADALTIIKGPYLQNVTPDSIVIMWETDSASDTFAKAADPTIIDSKTENNKIYNSRHMDTGNGVKIHEVRLNVPYSDYKYLYSVKSSDSNNDTVNVTGEFWTAPSSAKDFSFAVLGDTHVFSTAVLPAIVSSIMKGSPDLVLHIGDIEPYDQSLGDLQFFFNKMKPLIYNTPFFPIRGNHDVENSRDWFSEYFSLPNNEKWYTFTYGDVQFYGMDTNAINDFQTSWLERELRKSRATWKIVYLHEPPYTAGAHIDNEDVKKYWVPLFEEYGVNLVMSGHTHGYERYYDGTNNITYIVAGGGTSKLNKSWPGRTSPPVKKKLVAGVSHYCTVNVADGSLTLNARDTSGNSFDLVTIANTIPGPPQPEVFNATGQSMTIGTYENSQLTDTCSSDNVYESIKEAAFTVDEKTKYTALCHIWTFDIGGKTLSNPKFCVEAYQNRSRDGDNFVFSYSTNGMDYIPMITVTKTEDNNSLQSYSLPTGFGGMVYIKVQDTNSTVGSFTDTIYIDQMYISIN